DGCAASCDAGQAAADAGAVWIISAGPTPPLLHWVTSASKQPGKQPRAFQNEATHQSESRMREIRQSGSEGGAGSHIPVPTPMCESETMNSESESLNPKR